MYGSVLDHKEGWVLKNWCFWTVVLEKTLESPSDSKFKPVNPKGNQPCKSIGRTNAEAEATILWPHDVKSWIIGKDPVAGKDWGQEEKGVTEDEIAGWRHWLNGHKFEQGLKEGEGQGSLAYCSPWACRVGHNWITKEHQHLSYYHWRPSLPPTQVSKTAICVQVLPYSRQTSPLRHSIGYIDTYIGQLACSRNQHLPSALLVSAADWVGRLLHHPSGLQSLHKAQAHNLLFQGPTTHISAPIVVSPTIRVHTAHLVGSLSSFSSGEDKIACWWAL